jgi:uncharacterized membrane protein
VLGSVNGSATSTIALVVAVFGASLVEMVEALTLVVAAGTRSWRSAFEGTALALVVLGATTAIVGIPLAHALPIDALREVVGALLLLMGLSWLRKAILRAGGRLAKHDEDSIYARTVEELAGERESIEPGAKGRDVPAFLVAFKGVLLEGFEVVLIVISLGASSHRLGLAALAALAAVVVVTIAGVVLARQLSNVPENAIKSIVGIMLTSFGVFWVGEGAGVKWPGDDLAIPLLVVFFAFSAALMSLAVRRAVSAGRAAPRGPRTLGDVAT